MLNKALICIVMLAFVFGCANQQKDTEEKPAEETQEAEIAGTIEEVSLTVNGMT